MSVMLTMIYHICYITPISSAFRDVMMINDDNDYDDDGQCLVCWPWHVISPPSPQESDIRELSRGILGFWMSDTITRWPVMLMIHDFVYKILISVIAPFILKFCVRFVSNIHRLGLQSRSYKAWKQNQNCGWYNITLHYWENAILIQLRIMEYTDIVHIRKVQFLHNWLSMSSLELCCAPHIVFKQWSGGPVYNV